MPLVEFPGFRDWNVESVHLFSCIVEGLDSPSEVRSEAQIELKAFFLENSSCSARLLNAFIAEFKPI
jgi:hypothetical protein